MSLGAVDERDYLLPVGQKLRRLNLPSIEEGESKPPPPTLLPMLTVIASALSCMSSTVSHGKTSPFRILLPRPRRSLGDILHEALIVEGAMLGAIDSPLFLRSVTVPRSLWLVLSGMSDVAVDGLVDTVGALENTGDCSVPTEDTVVAIEDLGGR